MAINRVAAINWQTIAADGPVVPIPLQAFLVSVVMTVTQALQRAEPELVGITMMRRDVISDGGGGHFAIGQAHRAERLDPKLMLGNPSPALGSVQAHQTP